MKYMKLKSIIAFFMLDILSFFLSFVFFYGSTTIPIDSFFNFNFKIFIFCLGLCMLTMVINRFFVAKRFDPMFKQKLIDDEDAESQFTNGIIACLTSKSYRGTLYAINMVYRRFLRKNWLYGELFHGFNFYRHAKWTDIFFSYIYSISFAALFVTMVIVGTMILYNQLISLLLSI